MKRNSFLLLSFAIYLFSGCTSKDTDEKLSSYLKNECVFDTKNTCYLDLKKVFEVDYDTMFVFTEYTQLEGVRLILAMPDYNSNNVLLPKGFLVEDSHRKIILVKNRRIVYEDDIKSSYFDNGIEIKKVGIFDGEPYTHTANMFASSKFLVLKKSTDFYIFRNILNDGSILKIDTTSQQQ